MIKKVIKRLKAEIHHKTALKVIRKNEQIKIQHLFKIKESLLNKQLIIRKKHQSSILKVISKREDWLLVHQKALIKWFHC